MVNPRRVTRGLASCEWLEFSDSKNWPGHRRLGTDLGAGQKNGYDLGRVPVPVSIDQKFNNTIYSCIIINLLDLLDSINFYYY